MTLAVKASRRVAEIVALDLTPEGDPVDAQDFRGPGLVVVYLFKTQAMYSFSFSSRVRNSRRWGRCTWNLGLLKIQGQVCQFDGAAGAESYGPLDDIFQLPNISRKFVREQNIQLHRRNRVNLFALGLGELRQEMQAQERHVILARPPGWARTE